MPADGADGQCQERQAQKVAQLSAHATPVTAGAHDGGHASKLPSEHGGCTAWPDASHWLARVGARLSHCVAISFVAVLLRGGSSAWRVFWPACLLAAWAGPCLCRSLHGSGCRRSPRNNDGTPTMRGCG